VRDAPRQENCTSSRLNHCTVNLREIADHLCYNPRKNGENQIKAMATKKAKRTSKKSTTRRSPAKKSGRKTRQTKRKPTAEEARREASILSLWRNLSLDRKLDLLGIPAVFIYGPDGSLRYRLTGDDPNNQFTDADVDEAIEELLAAS